MNRLATVILIFTTIAVFAGCNEAPLTTDISVSPLPSSFKGYELYSWPVGDDWNFTLITGTNRTKTLVEITSQEIIFEQDGWVKITVLGIHELLLVLDRLPSSEQIFWLDGTRLEISQESSTITFPPEDVVEQVRQFSHQKGLDLQIVK